uniref:Uncharacterized protein n=1 Tax=Fundulus heteroclitus TaxID=8078 RepID=A0A3Q2QWZ3_FUNHE
SFFTRSLATKFHSNVHCESAELHRRYEAAPESTKTKALQTVIEMKVAGNIDDFMDQFRRTTIT